jgi:two-component system, cell cycle response regulator
MNIGDAKAKAGGANKILLAEDDATTLYLLQRTLGRWGFDVFTAADGEQALVQIKEHNVRLVVTDWEMPGLSGPELCQRLRADRSASYTYILLLTSRKDSGDVARGLEAGADDFITKPFDGTVLRARLAVGQRVLALQDRLQAQRDTLEQMNKRLSSMAYMDPLMSVGNRRAFHEAIDEIHSHARERGAAYGLIMADVDHFKSFNDTYGHQAGDRALAEVAKALSLTLRGGDQLFRYGGEELVVVTRTKTAAELACTTERLRVAVERRGITHANSAHGRLTCSLGGIQVGGHGVEPGSGWTDVVERADQALYMAKDRGRNRFEIWNEAGEQAA